MPVSTVAASAAVTACEGQSQWQAALLLFSGTKVDQILANAAISAAEKGSQWQVAMQILGDFDRWRLQKTEITYTAAISSCEPAGIWHVALALFLEMRHALPAREQGVQAGSVLLALRRALGLAKAEELLERFRRLWEEEVPQVEQRRVAGFRVLGSGCGVLAIDKPQGVETEVVISELRAALQRPISCTSRLDLPTSGVLPVALGDEGSGATQYLRAQWAARLVSKQYLCLCVGEALPATRGEIRRGIRPVPGNLLMQEVSPYGRPARTAYQVLASYSHPENESTLSLVQVQLLTGRKHQIRVHFASIGRPLAGDRRYGGANDFWCERMFLHCRRLQVRDLRGRRLVVKSPLPAELAALLKRLEKKRLAHIARAARLVATYDQFKTIYGNFGIKGNSNVVASSFTAGLVYSIITMPFESAKNRMASQKPDPETKQLPYRGTMQTISTVAGKEGALALYNGFFPYFLRCGGHTVLMFFAVEKMQKMYRTMG
ncbi:unnamed protein product [Effrenium voratum]|uniref:Pseudouridine synthase RsuA/RluA-like domain-containing protein n=1 Tax=Effrenium voratum TaxID=2562239 RepID=A0AA36J954_9DINO|nr:unnamed protein product [Effrenium voratum]